MIAELLIDCAACRHGVQRDDSAEQRAIAALREAVRRSVNSAAWKPCLRSTPSGRATPPLRRLPLLDEATQGDDLFNAETLKQLGVRVGGGIVAGAAASPASI